MKLLLDTHALLWFLREPHYLPPAVLAAIVAAGNDAAVSMASLWEIAIKVSLNKLWLPKNYDELFPQSVSDSGLSLLLIQPAHLAAVSRLPLHHRDPFDRLLVAQAMVEGLTLVSLDKHLTAYGAPVLW
jgi:PIN domain nuclease of toxin-antitoxin system